MRPFGLALLFWWCALQACAASCAVSKGALQSAYALHREIGGSTLDSIMPLLNLKTENDSDPTRLKRLISDRVDAVLNDREGAFRKRKQLNEMFDEMLRSCGK